MLELATPVASNTRTKLTDVSLAEVLERLRGHRQNMGQSIKITKHKSHLLLYKEK